MVVCLGCRDEQRGQAAVSMLKAEGCNVTFCRLDINDQTSVAAFANAVNATYGGLDILVNNAAVAYKGRDPTPFAQQARPTIRTNYYGTLAVCEALIPLMRNGGRVVNVASMSGPLRQFPRRAHDRILAPDFSRAELCSLVDNFVETAEKGLHGRAGWPNTCYGVSKAALNALTRILAREVAPRDILGEGRSVAVDVLEPHKLTAVVRCGVAVNSCCPGWCATDMSSHSGPKVCDMSASEGRRWEQASAARRVGMYSLLRHRPVGMLDTHTCPVWQSAAQGADTPAYLALLPPGAPSGQYWTDRQIQDWSRT